MIATFITFNTTFSIQIVILQPHQLISTAKLLLHPANLRQDVKKNALFGAFFLV